MRSGRRRAAALPWASLLFAMRRTRGRGRGTAFVQITDATEPERCARAPSDVLGRDPRASARPHGESHGREREDRSGQSHTGCRAGRPRGSSAETGAAVGFAVIPVETSEGVAGVAATTPVLISDGVAERAVAALCCVPRPALTSDGVTWAAGVAAPPGRAPSVTGDANADPAPAAAIPAATVSTASVSRIPCASTSSSSRRSSSPLSNVSEISSPSVVLSNCSRSLRLPAERDPLRLASVAVRGNALHVEQEVDRPL